MVERMDWSEGVSLQELIEWINEVAERFRGAEHPETSSIRSHPPRRPRQRRPLGGPEMSDCEMRSMAQGSGLQPLDEMTGCGTEPRATWGRRRKPQGPG